MKLREEYVQEFMVTIQFKKCLCLTDGGSPVSLHHVAHSFETLAYRPNTTWYNNPEDYHLYSHHRETSNHTCLCLVH